MAGSTYKVDIIYGVKGNAASGIKDIAREAKSTGSILGGLKSALAVVGGGALLAGGYKAFVGFNSEMQKLKIGLNTVIAMQFHVPFERANVETGKLFKTFQKMAADSPATTKDFVDMANMIAGGVIQAGLGMKGLETITKGAITASAALGANPEMLALDIQQMLAGTLSVKDRFAKQLLSGIGENDIGKFNKKSAAERGALTTKALDQPALQSAAAEFGNSFAGITSTLKDQLQMALGEVGLPLMKELTGEIKSWTTWISANPEKIAAISKSIAGGLKDAFSMVKDIGAVMLPILKDVFGVIGSVMSFVSEHRDVLIKVAEALLVYKGVSMAGGMIGGAAKGIGGMFGQMSNGIKGVVGAFTGAGGLGTGVSAVGGALTGLAGAAGPIALFGIALGGLAGLMLSKTEKEKKAEARAQGEILTAEKSASARKTIKDLEEQFKRDKIDPNTATLINPSLIRDKETLDKARADLSTTEVDLIAKAKSAGMMTTKLDPATGMMRMEMTRPDATHLDESSIKAQATLMAEVEAMFKANILQAREGANFANAMGDAARNMQDAGSWLGDGIRSGSLAGVLGFYQQRGVATSDSAANAPLTNPTAPKVTVNIHKIEVYSDDPDRFVAQAVQSFEEYSKNPNAAHAAATRVF